MPEMLSPTSLIMGLGLGEKITLITDGRFSGASRGACIGHVSPEAFEGGPIALINNGDEIEVDLNKGTLNVLLSEQEIELRRKNWTLPEHKKHDAKGALKQYRNYTLPANKGAGFES
uniref:Dehydratase family protein n=1 Tax=Candidatus Kentrum eta TaxID=2126337 RepID=A0A450VKA5_9GAMM|nr:MAG: Dehydratase family protein [Candidatus Kentron sp. H]VFK01939.1 MAG: Dehydratase family protein [Candidatus Kentron sp. H]VFK05244.1 MAG: Dehydratase family protein [Candidatus Kentron sp. H]